MKMKWNLRVLMAEHEIASASELMRRLEGVGVSISTAQASRIVKEMPSRLSVNILRGLLEVFRCQPNDLIIVEHNGDQEESTSKVRKIRPEKSVEKKPGVPRKLPGSKVLDDSASLTGPRVHTYPVKDKD